MDKKQFFQSLVSPLSDNSGYELRSYGAIRDNLNFLKSHLSSVSLQNEFEQIEKEILFHVWMLEQICNGEAPKKTDNHTISWPIILISVAGEIIFVNRAYCLISGLTIQEIQSYGHANTLYDELYEWVDASRARKAVSRLQAGQGYKHLELSMKHSGRKISWSSFGWVGESVQIRSGREICEENDQTKEQERFYRGNLISTAKLLGKLYQISIHESFSEEQEERLIWVQEFLAMFDFLWNHSELFMEIIDMPISKTGKITGAYNTVYAQFLKYTFQESKKFKDILSVVHGASIAGFLEGRNFEKTPSTKTDIFHQYNGRAVAGVSWQYARYPYELATGYTKLFSTGILVRKIEKKNIFIRIFRYFFKNQTH